MWWMVGNSDLYICLILNTDSYQKKHFSNIVPSLKNFTCCLPYCSANSHIKILPVMIRFAEVSFTWINILWRKTRDPFHELTCLSNILAVVADPMAYVKKCMLALIGPPFWHAHQWGTGCATIWESIIVYRALNHCGTRLKYIFIGPSVQSTHFYGP